MKKLLFIRYKKSRHIFEGGEQGSQKNHDALCTLLGEENVDTIYIHDETRRRSVLDYVRGAFWFPFGYYFGLTPSRVKAIVRQAMDYEFLYIDRSVFGIIAREARKAGYKGRIIAFFHNVEKIYFDAKLSGKPWKGIITRCADRNDAFCCRYADRIIALNARDSSLIEKFYGRQADVLLPVMFKDKYNRDEYPSAMTSRKPSCLFLGAYFAANNEGIEWFVRNVYPYVNVSLRIVGKGMGRLRGSDWLTPDIELVSDAPSLEPYFEEADIMILPIFKGSGMKVKTCESLMYGKNIIASDEAWEGYELDYAKAGGRCNSAEEFIACLKEFEASPRPRFNEYSRSVFLEKYCETLAPDKFRTALFG